MVWINIGKCRATLWRSYQWTMIITISIISIIIFSCKATASCKAIELARLIFLSEFTSYVARMTIAKRTVTLLWSWISLSFYPLGIFSCLTTSQHVNKTAINLPSCFGGHFRDQKCLGIKFHRKHKHKEQGSSDQVANKQAEANDQPTNYVKTFREVCLWLLV